MPDNNSNKIIGVILCGGKSSRMGSDKGLLFAENQRWFERSFDLLSKIFPKVVIYVNLNQYSIYKENQPNWEYVVDSIDFVEGPLAGIYSVYEKYPNSDLFVLACDMIYMTELAVRNLVSIYNSDSGRDFYFYQNENFLETLCGIYTANGLKELDRNLRANETKNFVIHKLVSGRNSLIIQIPEESKKSFANFNTQEEIGSEL